MITSNSNEKIKHVTKLIKSARDRKKERLYVVEGLRMFSEIPGELVHSVYATEGFEEKYKDVIKKVLSDDLDVEEGGGRYTLVSDSVMKSMSDTMSPQGILAVVKMQDYDVADIVGAENPLIIILESLQDPGNLGTIIRTAEGAGVTGILMSADTVDVYNPKVIRSTMGSLFRVPFVITPDIKASVCGLKEKGIKVYSAELSTSLFYDKDYTGPCAFIIGNEGNGVTKELGELADDRISIPMHGKVESLNAATAATVLMYESMRQRR